MSAGDYRASERASWCRCSATEVDPTCPKHGDEHKAAVEAFVKSIGDSTDEYERNRIESNRRHAEATEARYAPDARPWVIHCWVYNHDKWTDAPDQVLGPYPTRDAAETAATVLTCTHEITRVQWRLNPPEWTTTS